MAYRVKQHRKHVIYTKHIRLHKPLKMTPVVSTSVMSETAQTEFDAEFEAYVAKLKEKKVQQQAEQQTEQQETTVKKKRRKRKNVDDQGDKQEETDLKV